MILSNLNSILNQAEGLNIIKIFNLISSPSSNSITNILSYIIIYSINNLIYNNLTEDTSSSSVANQSTSSTTDFNLIIKSLSKNINILTFLLLFINMNLIDLTEKINYSLIVVSFILNIKTVKKYFDKITINLQICISNYGKIVIRCE